MFFRPRLVQFDNGKFGVRLGWFFGWKFRDLHHTNFAWGPGGTWFHHCQGTREEAETALSGAGMKHRVVSCPPRQSRHGAACETRG